MVKGGLRDVSKWMFPWANERSTEANTTKTRVGGESTDLCVWVTGVALVREVARSHTSAVVDHFENASNSPLLGGLKSLLLIQKTNKLTIYHIYIYIQQSTFAIEKIVSVQCNHRSQQAEKALKSTNKMAPTF